jgi:hypothetical protein
MQRSEPPCPEGSHLHKSNQEYLTNPPIVGDGLCHDDKTDAAGSVQAAAPSQDHISLDTFPCTQKIVFGHSAKRIKDIFPEECKGEISATISMSGPTSNARIADCDELVGKGGHIYTLRQLGYCAPKPEPTCATLFLKENGECKMPLPQLWVATPESEVDRIIANVIGEQFHQHCSNGDDDTLVFDGFRRCEDTFVNKRTGQPCKVNETQNGFVCKQPSPDLKNCHIERYYPGLTFGGGTYLMPPKPEPSWVNAPDLRIVCDKEKP